MLKIGKINVLKVIDSFPFGFYLVPPQTDKDNYDPEDAVLLPVEDAPEQCELGDLLDVFIYHDQDDRLVASIEPPVVQLKGVALLTCKRVTSFGAFVDWGLKKDLLVPNSEQDKPMDEGLSYVVYVYMDRETGRLAGSTRLHRFLSENGQGFKAKQPVKLLITDRSEMGFKAVINDTHLGLIYKTEVIGPLKIGQRIDGFIKRVRDDNKIDLCFQFHDDQSRNDLHQQIIDDLEAHGGVSTLTDKSPPDEIMARFGVSKGAYKKAIGALYKSRRIELDKTKITLLDKQG